MTKLIDNIRKYCIENYENGYDSCVECWDEDDYIFWVLDNNVKSVKGFIKSYAFIIKRDEEMQKTVW